MRTTPKHGAHPHPVRGRMKPAGHRLGFFILVALLATSSIALVQPSQAQTFAPGDLFFALDNGTIRWLDASGGSILDISTGLSKICGMRTSPVTGELWVTNFWANPGIRIVHTDGSLGASINFGYQQNPESVVFDGAGNAYVGGPEGELVKLSPDGSAVLDHWSVPHDQRMGPDWVDLCSDGKTLVYTSEGSRILRYDLEARAPLPDFADLSAYTSQLFAIRLLSDGSALVVDGYNVCYRVDSTGSVIRTYTPTSPVGLFALAIVPDESAFWVGGGAFYAPMYKFDIADGHVIQSLNASAFPGLNSKGVAVAGDGSRCDGGPITGDEICSPRSTLAINTGWDQFAGTLQPVGDLDNEWVILADPFPYTTERRPAFNIPTYRPGIAWADPQVNSNWISSYPSAAQDTNGTYAFEYRFCLASSDNASVAMSIRADDEATVYLNNFPIGTVGPGSFMYNVDPVDIQYTGNASLNLFSAGENTLRVEVRNVYSVAMGLNVVGTIAGDIPQYRYCCTDSAGGLLGKVWLDANGDGVMNGSEPTKAGWTVKLLVGTAVVRSTTTDIFGNYYFLDLAPGTYRVGSVYGQGTLPTTDVSLTVTLGVGQIVPNQDFGFRFGTRGTDVHIRNSPNPFNPQTSIAFSTAKPGRVSLLIYDVAGRLVRVLANEELPAGEHYLVWNGRDESGLEVGSGVYFYRLTADGNSQTGKMIMLK